MSLALVKTSSELDLGKIDSTSVISEAGRKRRDELLLEAQNVEQVTSEKSQQVAANTLGDLGAFLSTVEAQRVDLKAPFLKVGKKIDSDIGALVFDLEKEKARLKRLLADYQIKLHRQAQEERAKQEAQIAQLETQREAVTTAAEAEKIDQKIGQVLTPVEVVKPRGVSVAPVRRFRIIDVAKVYAARPDLCEVTLKANEINAAIRADKSLQIPGLEIYDDVDVRTSSR